MSFSAVVGFLGFLEPSFSFFFPCDSGGAGGGGNVTLGMTTNIGSVGIRPSYVKGFRAVIHFHFGCHVPYRCIPRSSRPHGFTLCITTLINGYKILSLVQFNVFILLFYSLSLLRLWCFLLRGSSSANRSQNVINSD